MPESAAYLTVNMDLQPTAAGAVVSRCDCNLTFGGLEQTRLRAVLPAVALDIGTKRWHTLILT